jgi:hypothetical protein
VGGFGRRGGEGWRVCAAEQPESSLGRESAAP